MSQFNLNKYQIKQPYPSASYYPYPEPTNTFGVNPLTLNSIRNLDVDDLQHVFSKGISDERDKEKTKKILIKKLYTESQEIKDIKLAIEEAKLNQTRCKQIQQKQILQLQKLVKDSEEDEMLYETLRRERSKEKEVEDKKQRDFLNMKKVNLEMIKEKERLKLEEGKKEYERDSKEAERIMNKILEEDRLKKEMEDRKTEISYKHMLQSIADREAKKQRDLENDLLEEEQIKKYLSDKAKRESGLKAEKDAIQAEKDRIFKKLSDDNAREKKRLSIR